MRPDHLPQDNTLQALPDASAERPLRVLFSGCMSGLHCGYDGTACGTTPHISALVNHPHVAPVFFCPEDFSFGTPRPLSNIHGGDGFDVLDGRARVLTESGEDWTDGMTAAAHRMLAIAQERAVDLAILLDISAACGSQVIYDGHRTIASPRYRRGPGVCAALLLRHGIPVISQRDYRSLELLRHKLDPAYTIDTTRIDHHETPWYREYFGAQT